MNLPLVRGRSAPGPEATAGTRHSASPSRSEASGRTGSTSAIGRRASGSCSASEVSESGHWWTWCWWPRDISVLLMDLFTYKLQWLLMWQTKKFISVLCTFWFCFCTLLIKLLMIGILCSRCVPDSFRCKNLNNKHVTTSYRPPSSCD